MLLILKRGTSSEVLDVANVDTIRVDAEANTITVRTRTGREISCLRHQLSTKPETMEAFLLESARRAALTEQVGDPTAPGTVVEALHDFTSEVA